MADHLAAVFTSSKDVTELISSSSFASSAPSFAKWQQSHSCRCLNVLVHDSSPSTPCCRFSISAFMLCIVELWFMPFHPRVRRPTSTTIGSYTIQRLEVVSTTIRSYTISVKNSLIMVFIIVLEIYWDLHVL